MPPYTWVRPVYVLLPVSVTTPEPFATTLPAPEITPLTAILPVLLLFSEKYMTPATEIPPETVSALAVVFTRNELLVPPEFTVSPRENVAAAPVYERMAVVDPAPPSTTGVVALPRLLAPAATTRLLVFTVPALMVVVPV